MAYKKYIKKDGKIYGPYLYHSRRVDDKVISEYYGHEKKRNYKNVFLSIAFILGLFFVIYGFSYIQPYFSGKAIFNIDADYEEGKPLEGVLKISLRQGEMLPSSSKIVFDNNGFFQEYSLRELISEENVEGSFYVQGKEIIGVGEGYGLAGEKEVYPLVYFELDFFSFNNSNSSEGDFSFEEPRAEEDLTEENSTEEIIIDNSTEELSNEETITEENSTEEIIIDNSTEELPIEEAITEENSTEEIIIDDTAEELSNEETITEESSDSSSEKKEKKEKEEKDKTSSDSSSESNEFSEVSITGSVISSFFRGISNLFLGITGTGRVAISFEKSMEGNASYEVPFIHSLNDMETVELKKNSVYIINSEGEKQRMEDSLISLDTVNGRVIVSTDYSEKISGFGEEYLGEEEKTLSIDLSPLNMSFEKGNLSIYLVYEEEEIISLATFLEEGKILTNETLQEIPVLNVTNQTILQTLKFVSSGELSEEEKAILLNHFGNLSVSTTKSEIFNGRLIRNYQLGDYEVKHSYDYNGEIDSLLEEQMQRDLMKWLRDIINNISRNESSSIELGELLGNFSLINEVENFSESIVE